MNYRVGIYFSISMAALLTLSACNEAQTQAPAVNAAAAIKTVGQAALQFSSAAIDKPNFIFMIGDDMGQETLSCYKVGQAQAHTPNLDKLCASGIRFDNFWSQAVCSPTRATLLTGQYGFKNGIGAPLDSTPDIDWKIPGGPVDDSPAMGGMGGNGGMGGGMGGAAAAIGVTPDWNLVENAPVPFAPDINLATGMDVNHHTFIAALSADDSRGYQTGAVGKWHLAGSENGAMSHPNDAGFDHYTGPMRGGGVAYYDKWSKSTNGGAPFGTTGYVTSDTVDDGIEWINTVDGEDPFFLWVAFNAPHTPFHMPPAELLTSDLKGLTQEQATPLQQYNAMIEAMDTEIGRLIASLSPETLANTYIAFMGDNGTPGQANQLEPYGRTKSKGSLYQGGVNVPFFIAGPGIKPESVSQSLANSVDVFDTVIELTGVADPKVDEAMHSVSLAPILLGDPNTKVRNFVFADVFGMSGPTRKNQRTISNGHYKLIEDIMADTVELYDLKSDPFEHKNLFKSGLSEQAQDNLNALRAELQTLTNAG